MSKERKCNDFNLKNNLEHPNFMKHWVTIIQSSINVCEGSSFLCIKKGKEHILQLALMCELEIVNCKVKKEFPFSPMYRDSLGNYFEVGDRTSLAPDISILAPFKCIIECKHGLSPEAVYQLMVYLDHRKDFDMGCTIEWFIDKDEKVMISSTLLIRDKNNQGNYFKKTITHDTGIIRNSRFVDI